MFEGAFADVVFGTLSFIELDYMIFVGFAALFTNCEAFRFFFVVEALWVFSGLAFINWDFVFVRAIGSGGSVFRNS